LTNYAKRLIRSEFVRNVAIVATGTASAQAITMAFAPLITRLYGPENYGLLGIFGSIVGLLSTIAALGYPTAIVLPKSSADAVGLAKLSLLTSLGIAILVAVLLTWFGEGILSLLNAEPIAAYIYLIPIAMMVSVAIAVLGEWLVREKAFKLIAKYRVSMALALSSVKTGIGFSQPVAIVLILTNTVGGALGSAITFWRWRRQAHLGSAEVVDITVEKSLRQLACQYRDFPLLRTPQNMINAISQSLPLFLLSGYSGAAAAGQYSIAIAVLGIPAALIGNSVMSVFYPRVTEAVRSGENTRKLIIEATAGMAIIGLIPYLVVILFGPDLFSFIFGAEWRAAGVYAQWLSVWLFLQFINKPAVSTVPALGLQGGLLIYELFSTGTKILALWLGFVFFENDVISIALFSILGSVAYIWLILWVIKRSSHPAGHAKRVT
jgi:O-antigen/teichoic acid export membrane protein